MSVSLGALSSARSQDLAKELAIVPSEPRRKWWLKYVLAGGALWGMYIGYGWLTSLMLPKAKTVVPAVAVNTVGVARQSSSFDAPAARLPTRNVKLLWTCGQYAGLDIEGERYELQTGESFNGVVLGHVGLSSASVAIDGVDRALKLQIAGDWAGSNDHGSRAAVVDSSRGGEKRNRR